MMANREGAITCYLAAADTVTADADKLTITFVSTMLSSYCVSPAALVRPAYKGCSRHELGGHCVPFRSFLRRARRAVPRICV